MEYYRLILYIIFGVLPSLTWLLYYLKKDLHPEPKRMIIKVFLYGALATVPVFFIQIGLSHLLSKLETIAFFTEYPMAIEILKWFFVIALTEELFKYLAVSTNVFGSWALDEPLDIMLYMVVAALGFAAVENILYLFSPIDNVSFTAIIQAAVIISFIRFIGATFLHTLCSAILGYFAALSFAKTQKRVVLTITGIALATLLHGIYNFSIMTLEYPLNLVVPVATIAGMAIFVTSDFNKIKGMKGISKI